MLSQSFGDPVAANEALEFDRSGNYLATGDRGGRIVIFREAENSINKNPKARSWMPYFQFQSHEAEFDYLKSLEIEEKINQIQFCHSVSDKLLLLSTNDKTVKLWKIFDRQQHTSCAEATFRKNGRLELPKRNSSPRSSHRNSLGSVSTVSLPKRVYKNAHAYHIHSISVNYDGESFISADDLRINTWNLDREDICLNVYDMKPPSMEELTEVITCVRAHPRMSSIMTFGTSRGAVKILDTRLALNGERTARTLGSRDRQLFFDMDDNACLDSATDDLSANLSAGASVSDRPGSTTSSGIISATAGRDSTHSSPPPLPPRADSSTSSSYPSAPSPTTPAANKSALSLFSEIISSVSDINFAPNGNYLISRDYLTVSVWDLRMDCSPVKKINVHEHVRKRMSSFSDPDCMFDKFQALVSPDSERFLTGSYSNQFGIWNVSGQPEKSISLQVPGGADVKNGAMVQLNNEGCVSGLGLVNGGKRRSRSGSLNGLEIRTDQKILYCAWHPNEPTVAVAGQAGVYLYTI